MRHLPHPMPLFFRVADVAELLGVDPRTVRRSIEADEIPGVRIGNTIRIPTQAFLEWAQIPQTDSEAGPSTGPTLAYDHSDATSEGAPPSHDPANTQPPASNIRALRPH